MRQSGPNSQTSFTLGETRHGETNENQNFRNKVITKASENRTMPQAKYTFVSGKWRRRILKI